ncbi:MAG TPA: hypothetical protein VHB20_05680 [Verrucomicrobiae bacterium]|jgi:hypothetical protein|nr:hypothetical protein [Verrucomicrobiae bacterium]
MKTIQFIAVAAAAGLMAGCSTNDHRSVSSNDHATPGTSMNAAGGATSEPVGQTDMAGSPGASVNNPNQASYSSYNSSSTMPDTAAALSSERSQLSFDQLPASVQSTIRNQIGDQQITKIKQETKDGQTAYKIEFQRKDWYSMRPTITVAADGSILKESHLKKNYEAAGAQAPENQSGANSIGSQANPSGVNASTNTMTGGEK